jgi:hypothetical protein
MRPRWAAAVYAMALQVGGCAAGVESAVTSPEGAEVDSSMMGAEVAPASMGAPVFARWVGVVEETDVRAAVVAGKGKARLYFCGGAQSYATTTRWFDIWFDGGEHVEFEQDAWRVHAHLTGQGLVGEIELGDGVIRTLRAQLVAPGTLAGLYEGKAACGHVGLIVTQDTKSEAPAAQGACTNDTDQSVQSFDVSGPITAEGRGIRVQTSVAAGKPLLLQAATLDGL